MWWKAIGAPVELTVSAGEPSPKSIRKMLPACWQSGRKVTESPTLRLASQVVASVQALSPVGSEPQSWLPFPSETRTTRWRIRR